MISQAESNEILWQMPHRPPFLLIDRVCSLAAEEIHARRLVSFGDPWLTGDGCLPAPLLVESITQAATALLLGRCPNSVPMLLGITHATFGPEARAGDELEVYAEIQHLRRRVGRAVGWVRLSDGTPLCDAEFTFAWSPLKEMARKEPDDADSEDV